MLGVELGQELGAALGLVLLADARRGQAEALQRPEEALVLGRRPADVATPPPAVRPQAVEASVVADAVGGVRLDVVTAQVAERRPPDEAPRPAGDDGAHRGTLLGRRLGQRGTERGEGLGGSGSSTVDGGPEAESWTGLTSDMPRIVRTRPVASPAWSSAWSSTPSATSPSWPSS